MIRTIEEAIQWMEDQQTEVHRVGLNKIQVALDFVGNPQRGLKTIHIGGTNGKGSTASMFQSVFQESNLSVGLFTSPHLEVVNERIRLNGENITDADFIRLVDVIEPHVLELEEQMKQNYYAFELLTAVAFLYFQEKQPDIILLEAGIGGRKRSFGLQVQAEGICRQASSQSLYS